MSIADLVSTLVPKDRGVRRVAHSLAYGPHARHNLDVYAPLATGTGPLPVIVFFYGGGWTDGTRHHYGFAAHALASLGYVVVVPDYRLVHKESGAVVYLEVLGFWRKSSVEKHLERLAGQARAPFVLAVSEQLHIEEKELAQVPAGVHRFRTMPLPDEVARLAAAVLSK